MDDANCINVSCIGEIPKTFTGKACYSNGEFEWFKDGLTHRIGGPAIITKSGYKGWYENGKLHREDGPAREWNHQSGEYYYKGKPILKDNEAFFVNGKFRDYSRYDEVVQNLLNLYRNDSWLVGIELRYYFATKEFGIVLNVTSACTYTRDVNILSWYKVKIMAEEIKE